MMSVYAILISFVEAVLYLTGAPDMESLSQDTVECYSRLAEHPVQINFCSRSELVSTGLFSAYQAAVLSGYVEQTGSVLSIAELSLLDGFGEAFVQALSFFIDLAPGATQTSTAHSHSVNTSVVSRLSYRQSVDRSYSSSVGAEPSARKSVPAPAALSAGLRCDVDVGGRALFWLGSSGFRKMESLTAGVSYIGKRRRTNLIVGDFNARFGQGTGLWNTMTMSSLSSVSSLLKRPSGFSASTSFASNYALTGTAFSAELGKHSIYAALALPGLKSLVFSRINKGSAGESERTAEPSVSFMPVLGYSCWCRHISFGLTASSALQKNSMYVLLSADARTCVSSVDIAAEFTSEITSDFRKARTGSGRNDARFYAVAAVSAPVGECFKAGARAGYSPSVHSVTSCIEYSDRKRAHSAVFSVEPSYRPGKGFQTKLFASYKYSWGGSYVGVRSIFRHQTYSTPAVRGSLRIDVSIDYCDRFVSSARIETLYCGGPAVLSYLEQSFLPGGAEAKRPLKMYFRAGVFFVDDWNRRIYVYERDVPGCFNVPAFYGRGLWLSSYLNWRFSRWGRLAFRFAYTAFPFGQTSQKKKPDRIESRIQASFSF